MKNQREHAYRRSSVMAYGSNGPINSRNVSSCDWVANGEMFVIRMAAIDAQRSE